MRIALTGATGFVGQAVLDEAMRREDHIRALTRRAQPNRRHIDWIEGDLSNSAALASLCHDVDAILHVAGLTNTPDPTEFEDANVGGTQRLLAAAKEKKVKRLIFVSSLSAREPDLSAYGASKAKAEKLVEASSLDWTIVRPPGVYGPRDVDYFEMFRSAKYGLVPLPPGGASSIIHVDDLARLLLDLVDASPALVRKRTFEPDDGREGGWSHKELAKEIGKAVGRPVFAPHLPTTILQSAARIDRIVRGDKARLTADRVGYMTHPNWVARSAMKVPDAVWSPRIEGAAGLASTANWYRDAGWL
ncbi:NAD-dependent epimerase/dehydratase family protein [Qipengyuania qiaonensis]|uniref:NAD(P)-dependent oxidoreductase n=1 Tax=Qipengyuania qiaonensis TaxID=2867240 RepID=A0ABS7JBP0_9SPHN|nr:NAD(P)-dependent oxidoreductase [Qipengyuania qiaonensis]MBX7482427.1 NAD(P)-dependent oxidoreductase [Qipengyuania qiaonensis]